MKSPLERIKTLWQREREELLELYRKDGGLTARDYIGLRKELDQWYLGRIHSLMSLQTNAIPAASPVNAEANSDATANTDRDPVPGPI